MPKENNFCKADTVSPILLITMMNNVKIFIVILLCSCSSIAYEIALTRIFSISLWYHFAFMIISIAMLGIGASGTVLSLYPKLKNISYLQTYCLLLGAGIFISYLISNRIPFDPVKLSWSKIQVFYIGFYYVVLSIPFFFMGLIIATALSSMSKKIGLFYGADLIGAGLGSIAVISMLTLSGPDTAVFYISSIALLSAFIAGGRKQKLVSAVFLLIIILLLLFPHPFLKTRISEYKGLPVALRYPGAEHLKTYYSPHSRIDSLISPAARFAPGLSLRYLQTLPDQIGFSIDAGEIYAVTAFKEKISMQFLSYIPSALPYELVEKKDVLILDDKGGLQSLVADYYGSSNIYKIESNPLIIKIIKKDFHTFSGKIYSQNTWTGLGRSWLKKRKNLFDIIDIPLFSTTPTGSFGISEDYRFTVDAFKEYLKHLKPDGILQISLFILPPPRIEFRLLNTAVNAMDELGIKNSNRHIASIRSWGTISILVKKSPITLSNISTIRKFSRDRRFDLLYYPGINVDETNVYVHMPSDEYFTSFLDILSTDTRKKFINNYIWDVSPATDDKPFFHYYLKTKNIREIYKIMGKKWQYFAEEGYILPFVFMQVLFLGLILVILPAFSNKQSHNSSMREKGQKRFVHSLFLPYFACIGIGFMFIEVSFIQKIILPLEHPSYAFATILTSLLMSAGIGSLFRQRFHFFKKPNILIVLSLVTVSYSILIPSLTDLITLYTIPVRILLVYISFIPIGFFMGIPFPNGLIFLGEKDDSLIPWAWAINGCFSVLAPILAIMIAIAFGFKTVLWIGAGAYFLAYIIYKTFTHPFSLLRPSERIEPHPSV